MLMRRAVLAEHLEAAGRSKVDEAAALIVIAGISIPSTSPLFLAGVGLHFLFALLCAISGAVAMLSPKRAGRHPRFGSIYFWSLGGVFVTATVLTIAKWSDDYLLFFLGLLSFAAAILGRQARRSQWLRWPRWHVTGMGISYIVMLTAFYVDNGKNLPVWRGLPAISYWLAPSIVGLPILLYVLVRHPLILSLARSIESHSPTP
jgi:hypothetical protein